MSAVNGVSQLTGMFKEVYGNKIEDIVPGDAIITKSVPFAEYARVGNYFNVPTTVSREKSCTFYTNENEDSTTLLAANSGQLKNAQVTASNGVMRAKIGYAAMMKAAQKGDKKAFERASDYVIRNTAKSMLKRVEIMCLHGQLGLGIIESVSGSSTTRAWVISAAEWCPTIFAGEEGVTFDVMHTGALHTKVNTNAPVVLVSVDVPNRTLNVSGNATDLTAIIATDVIFWETASDTNEFAGVHKILTNVGLLNGIDAATFSVWGGNVYSATTGTPSLDVINAAVAMCASYGARVDMEAHVSPKCWGVLASDLAAQRTVDSSYSSAEVSNGSRKISYFTQTGKISIISNPYQKDGQIDIFPPEECLRPGACDPTFLERGGETLILEGADSPNSEVRAIFNLGFYMSAPRHGVTLTGVTV